MFGIVKVGIAGSGFVAYIHHSSFKVWVRDVEVLAVDSANNDSKFAHEKGIERAYSDYHEMRILAW